MKNRYSIYIPLVMILLALFPACYKDKGNYAYNPINVVAVSDTFKVREKTVMLDDTLRIEVKIAQSLEKDASNLEYEWKAYDLNSNSFLLSTQKDLNYIVKHPLVLGNFYNLYYKVTDRNTGVSVYTTYRVTVNNPYAQGWLILEERDGGSDFSIILMNDKIIRNLYSSLNGKVMPGKPVCLYSSISPKKLYMATDSYAAELSPTTYTDSYGFDGLFFSPPAVKKPNLIQWNSSTGLFINDNKIHSIVVSPGLPGSVFKWGSAVVSPEGSNDYQLAPYLAFGATYSIVVFDRTKKRFGYFAALGSKFLAFPTAASTVFDMNDVKMDMVFMEPSSTLNEYNAIMKDDAGKPWLLRFKTTTTVAAPASTIVKTAMDAPLIFNATSMSNAFYSPHIYYGIGNIVYRYETTSNTNATAYTFPSNEAVTYIKCTDARLGYPATLVVTWNGTESKVYFFIAPGNGSLILDRSMTGFGKIKDIKYKQ